MVTASLLASGYQNDPSSAADITVNTEAFQQWTVGQLRDYIHDVTGVRPHISSQPDQLIRQAATAALEIERRMSGRPAGELPPAQPQRQQGQPPANPLFRSERNAATAAVAGPAHGVTMRGLPTGAAAPKPLSPFAFATHPEPSAPPPPGSAIFARQPVNAALPRAGSPFGQAAAAATPSTPSAINPNTTKPNTLNNRTPAAHPLPGSAGSDTSGGGGSGGQPRPSRPLSMDPLLSWMNSKLDLQRQSGNYTTVAAVAAADKALAERTSSGGAQRGDATPPLGPRNASGTSNTSAGSEDMQHWVIKFEDLELDPEGQGAIGKGSFGQVYQGNYLASQVAIKVLSIDGNGAGSAASKLTLSNPMLATLHEVKARLMASMRHPNVVLFMGVCPDPAIIVTEFCARGSLLDVIRKASAEAAKGNHGMLSWLKRLNMMMDAAKGVLCLHAHNPPIIHRDLKSANFLVDEHWRVKVTDFGLSRIMEESTGSSSTMMQMNPRWLAPETLSGHRATVASDAFAFGVVMWELLTWDVPWGRRTNQWNIAGRVVRGKRLEVPPRAQLPGSGTAEWAGLDRYVALMKRCWSTDPAARPTMKDIILELRALLQEEVKVAKAAMGEGGAERFSQVRPDQGECAICLAAAPTAQFIHQGSSHQCACKPCAEMLQKSGDKRCPVCRQEYLTIVYDVFHT